MNMKDKNNELSRKNSELEARLKESEDMADASLLAVDEKQSEIFKQQSVIDLQRDKIAGLEAVLTSVKQYLNDTEALISKMPNSIKAASLLYGVNRALDLIDGLNLSNPTPVKPMPVAKPIVWEKVQLVEFGKIGKFQIQVYEAWENNKPEEKELPFIFDIYYGDYHSNAYITLECVKRFLTMEEAKQAAQDWLNKLVAECAVMGNPTPQFTADEIEAIRKIAQFMGVTVADSIIAKCDAMLKGAQK